MSCKCVVWDTPAWEYTEHHERVVGRGKRKRIIVNDVVRTVYPRTFLRSSEAYKHARKSHMPIRQVHMCVKEISW